ncbi:transporter [Actinomyces wuliandei]|uniref:transporter n=1 Tax=Actinomyces wuliandei TaxID=2057743 RepID=UPI000FDACE87|nr:transporter [Actinomyces wuliandei]
MVATLVKMRWLLTLNALRGSTWALVGTVVGGATALGGLGVLTVGALALGRVGDPQTVSVVLGSLGALLVLGWILLPLLATGLDSSLDPRAVAAWAAPSRRLAQGLLVAGACGASGAATAVVCLLPTLTWLVSGQLLAAVLALVCAPAALATCVVVSRVVVVWIGISGSRRGQERVALAATVVYFVACLVPAVLGRFLSTSEGVEVGLRTAGQVVSLSPLGWAFAAPGLAATGAPLVGAALTLGAWLVPVLLLRPWERVVTRVMTTPGRGSGRSRTYGAPTSQEPGSFGAGALDVLPWSRRLGRLLPGPACAVAARSMRYWRTDPRYLVMAVSAVMLPVFFVVGAATGSAQALSEVDGVGVSLAAGQAPGLFLMAAPALALMVGWSVHNDLGGDSTALWSNLSAGLPGRQDLLGRAVGALPWQAPVVLAAAVGLCWWTGRWDAVASLVGACVALHGCSLGWSCLASVLMPYETNAPGESPLVSRTSGTVVVAALVHTLGMLVILLAAAPVLGAALGAVLSGASPWWGWVVLVVGALWGAGAVVVGTTLGGRWLDQRGPEILATIRSWPRHAQET